MQKLWALKALLPWRFGWVRYLPNKYAINISSYPFIEIIGEPGAGKTTLIEFMWKLLGRHDYEGFDPSKSTPAAQGEELLTGWQLARGMIESDRGDDTSKSKMFDWDELKNRL